jgi:hypothetical protein
VLGENIILDALPGDHPILRERYVDTVPQIKFEKKKPGKKISSS